MGPVELTVPDLERSLDYYRRAIGLGVREAGQALHIRPQTAGRAFQVLIAKGFLRIGRNSAFNVKSKLAREWIVTLFPFRDSSTNDFIRWRPEVAQIAGPIGAGGMHELRRRTASVG